MRMVIAATSSATRGPVAAAPSLCECLSSSSPGGLSPAAQFSAPQDRDCTTESWRPSASEYVTLARFLLRSVRALGLSRSKTPALQRHRGVRRPAEIYNRTGETTSFYINYTPPPFPRLSGSGEDGKRDADSVARSAPILAASMARTKSSSDRGFRFARTMR